MQWYEQAYKQMNRKGQLKGYEQSGYVASEDPNNNTPHGLVATSLGKAPPCKQRSPHPHDPHETWRGIKAKVDPSLWEFETKRLRSRERCET